MLAALIGDVVRSREAANRRALGRTLDDLLDQVNARVPAAQPLTVTIGDEFQGAYHDLALALRAALRLGVCAVGRMRLRIGIGWGDLLVSDDERTPYGQDGPCWWRARTALDRLRKAESGYGQPPAWRTAAVTETPIDGLLNGYLMSRDELVAGLDTTDAHILTGLWQGLTQTAVAGDIGLDKSSVSKRFRHHGIAALIQGEPGSLPMDVMS